MDGNSKFVVIIFGCLVALGLLGYALVAPTWDDGKTNALIIALIGCPTMLAMLAGGALALDWRDKRQTARREQEMARRQHGINVKMQDAQEFNANAFVMRQTLDLLGQVAQVQARQAGAGLADLKQQVFAQRAIDAPGREVEPAWFTGDWDYGTDETTANVEATGGIRYL